MDRNSQKDTRQTILRYKRYRLKPFAEIIEEMLWHVGTLDNLQGLEVLEMGPSHRINLMRFLANETKVKSIHGIGRALHWPWALHRAFFNNHVTKHE